MEREELIKRYNAGERDFTRTDLAGADLQGIDLTEINLFRAYLYKTNLTRVILTKAILTEANLTGANLSKANLSKANLYEANLSGADLSKANLSGTDLSWVNLSGADLSEVNLTKANLSGADLIRADLYKTNLTRANLQGTCLDPQASVPKTNLSCFETDGDYIIGYRTKDSQHCGNTTYEPGNHYVAPWFSICTKTSCHPGIYLATLDWLKNEYPNIYYVKVKALKSEVLNAGDKYRAKQVWVIENV